MNRAPDQVDAEPGEVSATARKLPQRPDYEHSIVSLANRIVTDLGGEPAGPPLRTSLGGARRIVLAVVDGLGATALGRALDRVGLPGLCRAVSLSPISSTFPTTTAAGLMSLCTGLPPALHGSLGFTVAVPGRGPVCMLTLADLAGRSCRPGDLFGDFQTVYERLSACGVSSAVVLPAAVKGGAFSGVAYRGADLLGYEDLADAPALVDSALAGGAGFVFGYLPEWDAAAHEFGPDDPRADEVLTRIDRALAAIGRAASRHDGTRMFITADHGMADARMALRVPREAGVVAGDARALYTTLAPFKAVEVLGTELAIMPAAALWEKGYFGGRPGKPEWPRRTLRSVIQPPAGAHFETENLWGGMVGAHGGLSEDEVLVPLLTLSDA